MVIRHTHTTDMVVYGRTGDESRGINKLTKPAHDWNENICILRDSCLLL